MHADEEAVGKTDSDVETFCYDTCAIGKKKTKHGTLIKIKNDTKAEKGENMKEATIEDYICPIDLDLMLEPVKLPCFHFICQTCCNRLLRMKQEHRKCPLCRAKIPLHFDAATVDADMCKAVTKLFPNEVKELRNIRRGKLKEFSLPKLRLKYGNRYMKVQKPKKSRNGKHVNRHSWDAFVVFCDEKGKRIVETNFVKDVVMDFSAYVKTVWGKRYFNGKRCKGFFRTGGTGWGYFDFDIKIRFQDELNLPHLNFTHELCFERGGEEHEVDVELTARQAYLIGLLNKAAYKKYFYRSYKEFFHEKK
eukprot:g4438.t1